MNLEVKPGEKREVSTEYDERSVHHVDHVEHSPDQGESHGDARINRAEHQAIEQNLRCHEVAPSTLRGGLPSMRKLIT